jgi:fibronectin type 3 domain-containing protein
MKDDTPPKKPIRLSGKIDTSGVVNVHWKLGPEPDLLGYLVYYANAPDHVFTPVSEDFLADSTFADSVSLRTLTKKIYYRVVAFDKNRNPSPPSDILELKKPDKLPPVPAVFSDFRVTDSTVYMNWAPSTSSDLVSQVLYRREKGSEWLEYGKFDNKTKDFVDKEVKKQTWYEYSLVSVDDAGLQSEKSFPLNVRVYDSGIRQNIENFTAIIAPDGKTVQLSWKYPKRNDLRFILYRSFNNSGLLTYRALSPGESSFTDLSVRQGAYEYALKAVYVDGGESLLTKPIKINVDFK